MDIDLSYILIRLVIGLLIGFVIGLTGIGAVLVVPSLTVILGLPASIAVGTASMYAFLSRAAAAYHHFQFKTIDFSISLFFLLGAVPANLATSIFINGHLKKVADNAEAVAGFQTSMKMIIAGMIIVAAVVLTLNLFRRPRVEGEETGIAMKLDRKPALRRSLAVMFGAMVGALMGATAIGGGVIVVPLLILVFGLPSSQTVGSAIFIATILTFQTAVVYARGAQMDWLTGLIMAAGSLVSVKAGSKLAVGMPEKSLRIVVICVVLISAVLMIIKQANGS